MYVLWNRKYSFLNLQCIDSASLVPYFAILLNIDFHLATLPYSADWWSAAEMAVLLEYSPNSKEPCESEHLGFWSPTD